MWQETTDSNSRWIDQDQLEIIFHMVRCDPTIRACRDRLSQAILSGGIKYNNSKGKATSDEFKNELDQWWLPFAQNIFDDIFMFGFSAYTIEKSKIKVNGVLRLHKHAVCLPFGTYKTQIRRKEYSITWHGFPLEHGIASKANRDIKFMKSCSEWLPTIQGQVHTPVSTLIESFRNIHELYHHALVAESIRSKPQLVTVAIKNDRSFEETAMFEDFSDKDGDLFHQEQQERRTEREAMTLQMQQELTRSLNAASVSGVITDPITKKNIKQRGALSLDHNTIHLSDGRTTAGNVPTATCRTDLVQLERMHQDRICAVLGIPRAIVMSEHNIGSSNDVDNANITFRRTVDSFKAELTRMLNIAYCDVYRVPEGNLSLPGIPLTSVNTIQHLYNEGIINKKTQAKYLIRAAGASEKDIDMSRMTEMDDLFMQRKKNEIQQRCNTEENVDERELKRRKTVDAKSETDIVDNT